MPPLEIEEDFLVESPTNEIKPELPDADFYIRQWPHGPIRILSAHNQRKFQSKIFQIGFGLDNDRMQAFRIACETKMTTHNIGMTTPICNSSHGTRAVVIIIGELRELLREMDVDVDKIDGYSSIWVQEALAGFVTRTKVNMRKRVARRRGSDDEDEEFEEEELRRASLGYIKGKRVRLTSVISPYEKQAAALSRRANMDDSTPREENGMSMTVRKSGTSTPAEESTLKVYSPKPSPFGSKMPIHQMSIHVEDSTLKNHPPNPSPFGSKMPIHQMSIHVETTIYPNRPPLSDTLLAYRTPEAALKPIEILHFSDFSYQKLRSTLEDPRESALGFNRDVDNIWAVLPDREVMLRYPYEFREVVKKVYEAGDGVIRLEVRGGS